MPPSGSEPCTAQYPFLAVDGGFTTDPSLVRVFLNSRNLSVPLFDEWLRFKALLRTHAPALWFVDPSEVAVVITGPRAQIVLREALTKRQSAAVYGPQLESLWYEHATEMSWESSSEADLTHHARSVLDAADESDEVEQAWGDLDPLGNHILGCAATLVLHGTEDGRYEALAPALNHVRCLVTDARGVNLKSLRGWFEHRNGVYESTRSLLRRLPAPQRATVRRDLLDPLAAFLRSLILGGQRDDLIEARVFVDDEIVALGGVVLDALAPPHTL